MKAMLAAVCILLAGCAERAASGAAAAPGDSASIENGRVIAERECASCHAVGATGASPRADAPPLRTVLAHYRSETLTEDLNEGIRVGHPDMPQFTIPIQGADDLIAYLRSIQAQEP